MDGKLRLGLVTWSPALWQAAEHLLLEQLAQCVGARVGKDSVLQILGVRALLAEEGAGGITPPSPAEAASKAFKGPVPFFLPFIFHLGVSPLSGARS